MQGAQVPQEHDVQLHIDPSSLTQDSGIQQVDSNPERMAHLLAKVPNLALLAAGFFAAEPIWYFIQVGGGVRHG